MGDPDYMKNYGIEVIDSNIINIHGSLEVEDVPETQQLVIQTSTMSTKDWINARYFAHMIGFLYFNKILQIPIVITNTVYGISYKKIFESFLKIDADKHPSLSKIQNMFFQHAKDMTSGGPEFVPSKKWLNIYWKEKS